MVNVAYYAVRFDLSASFLTEHLEKNITKRQVCWLLMWILQCERSGTPSHKASLDASLPSLDASPDVALRMRVPTSNSLHRVSSFQLCIQYLTSVGNFCIHLMYLVNVLLRTERLYFYALTNIFLSTFMFICLYICACICMWLSSCVPFPSFLYV